MTSRIPTLTAVFSETVSELIPEWTPFLSLMRHDKSSWCHYTLRIPGPVTSSEETDLIITSDYRVIWVMFGECGYDYRVWGKKTPKQACTEALSLAKEIVSEEVAAISFWQEDFKKAICFGNPQQLHPSVLTTPHNRMRIRYWSGQVQDLKP